VPLHEISEGIILHTNETKLTTQAHVYDHRNSNSFVDKTD